MKGINTNKKVTAVIYAVMIMLVTTTVAIGVYDFNIKTGTITVDNKSQEVKTKKTTVGEVLEEQQITLDDNDYINIPENKKIEKDFNIKIKKAIPVTVSFRGKQKNVKTSDTTVKDVLKSNSMTYYENDEITPALETKVTKDMKITVTRYEQKTNIVEEEIEFETQENENAQLQKGKSLTVQEGSKGIKENTVKELYKNGELISTETTESKVVKEPVAKIIQNGTKIEMTQVASRGESNSKVASNSSPSLQGARSMVMKASAYDLSFESCGKNPGDEAYGITASGTHAKPGTVAVDPRVIPLGTKLYIESMDGYGSYGYATAEDTGGAIKGNRIDLFYSNKSDALDFGRREVKVYILD